MTCQLCRMSPTGECDFCKMKFLAGGKDLSYSGNSSSMQKYAPMFAMFYSLGSASGQSYYKKQNGKYFSGKNSRYSTADGNYSANARQNYKPQTIKYGNGK